jgi:hypothetical protein
MRMAASRGLQLSILQLRFIRGSMNRSVCRKMVGVAGLAVLGMSATLAGAQTDQVKEKPGLYTYASYWAFPRAHWGDIDKDNATGNQKILAPALADGTLVGYGDDEKQSAEGHFYNRKAGSWNGAYGYTASYKFKPDVPHTDDAVRTLDTLCVPLFEKLLADGTIVEYEIDGESVDNTDSRPQFVFLVPSAEHLDKLNAAIDAAIDENPLIGSALASMTSMTVDWARVNATYK